MCLNSQPAKGRKDTPEATCRQGARGGPVTRSDEGHEHEVTRDTKHMKQPLNSKRSLRRAAAPSCLVLTA